MWWPWHPQPFSCVTLSCRQQQPQGPQDKLDPSLHHTSSTPTLPRVPPTPFYTVTYLWFTGSALATPPLTPPWKVQGMHDKGAHALCWPCSPVRRSLAVRSVYASELKPNMQVLCKARHVEAWLKRWLVTLLYDYNYSYSVYHSY